MNSSSQPPPQKKNDQKSQMHVTAGQPNTRCDDPQQTEEPDHAHDISSAFVCLLHSPVMHTPTHHTPTLQMGTHSLRKMLGTSLINKINRQIVQDLTPRVNSLIAQMLDSHTSSHSLVALRTAPQQAPFKA